MVDLAYMRGSRRQMALWVARAPELEPLLADWDSLAAFRSSKPLEWISPVAARGYREIRDTLFSELGFASPTPQSAEFWPRRGPVWDGVARVKGRDGQTGVLLVEAKSHIAELASPPTGAAGERRELIQKSLTEVQGFAGAAAASDWTGRYYQLTNRLAYLYYLRKRANEHAWLLSIYFCGDSFGAGGQAFPEDADGWETAIHAAKSTLGLPAEHALSPYLRDLFLPAISE
jgi:hypothetical protein